MRAPSVPYSRVHRPARARTQLVNPARAPIRGRHPQLGLLAGPGRGQPPTARAKADRDGSSPTRAPPNRSPLPVAAAPGQHAATPAPLARGRHRRAQVSRPRLALVAAPPAFRWPGRPDREPRRNPPSRARRGRGSCRDVSPRRGEASWGARTRTRTRSLALALHTSRRIPIHEPDGWTDKPESQRSASGSPRAASAPSRSHTNLEVRVVRDGRARLLCVGSPPPPASWAVVLTQPVGPAETRRTV